MQTFLPCVQLLKAIMNFGDACVHGFCQATIQSVLALHIIYREAYI